MEISTENRQKDLVVIGGGPAGYVAAIRGSQLGLNTALIERENLGGTCLNVGCIPMKTLGKTAAYYSLTKKLTEFGISVGESKLDMERVQVRKAGIIKQLVGGVNHLLKVNKVEIIKGDATLLSPTRVKVTAPNQSSLEIETRKIILATGTRPRSLPGLEPDGKHIVTSTDALAWKEVPARVAIIGGGVVGMEFADFLVQVGSQVTVIEALPGILFGEDADAGTFLVKALVKKGVRFYTNARVEDVNHLEEGTRVTFKVNDKAESVLVDKVLVAVGRTANLDGLGLENAGIKPEKGQIPVNNSMYTGSAEIYAAGDIVPGLQLAHVAYEEGTVAAENAAGKNTVMNYSVIPRCVYTHPEIAAVGVTEAKAREKYGDAVKVAKVPFTSNGKALLNGSPEGFIKIVTEKKYGEILGITIVGDSATELIAEGSLAMKLEAVVEEVANTIHPHPSISEIVKEVSLLALGNPIHAV